MRSKIFCALLIVIVLLNISGCKKTTESEIPFLDQTVNLVGYWTFSGNANDESGRGNNGIITEATQINDRFGSPNSAYYFDGIDDYITIKEVNGSMNLMIRKPNLPFQLGVGLILEHQGLFSQTVRKMDGLI